MRECEKINITNYLNKIGLQHLITKKMYNKSFDEVLNILEMIEWNNPRFKQIFTKDIWYRSYEAIKEILNMTINDTLIWDDERFQVFLSPKIWHITPNNLRKKLSLPLWDNPKYIKFLTFHIFNCSEDKIISTIDLFERLGIINQVLGSDIDLQKEIIEALYYYFIENDISPFIDGRLHPAFRARPKKQILKTYGINIDQLLVEYKLKKARSKDGLSQ